MQRAKRQREAVAIVRKIGGKVEYEYQRDSAGNHVWNAVPPGPAWLRNVLGIDFFCNATFVFLPNTLVTDSDLDCLRGLTSLENLQNLESLQIGETQVTNAGIANLQNALPKLKIR